LGWLTLANEYSLTVTDTQTGQRIVCAAAVKTKILRGQAGWIEHFPEAFKLNSGGDDSQTADISVQISSVFAKHSNKSL